MVTVVVVVMTSHYHLTPDSCRCSGGRGGIGVMVMAAWIDKRMCRAERTGVEQTLQAHPGVLKKKQTNSIG